ncbi:hypothetical protein [Paraburkholderia fynbosensis]|uniref:Uncharacterized protein n=1 Tax=Paraburkholderia fynbosensis TaxID=1200993 RepID=A0A6J5GUE1_9BURK|nr:hypothetical protein [Paraburkholderia fynbosensis]CAB3805704.1 hypothetical protein LMG27177_05909 [Paraburkholderia fynbosensis]
MTLQASPVAAAEHPAAAPRSYPPAHIITSDAEAIGVAQNLASRFAANAARRDRERTLPLDGVMHAFTPCMARCAGNMPPSAISISTVSEHPLAARPEPNVAGNTQTWLGSTAANDEAVVVRLTRQRWKE